MKIKVEHIPEGENEIILRCKEMDDEMFEIMAFLKDRTTKIGAYKDGTIFMIMSNQVYYAEAVDGKNFVYTKDSVYDIYESLTQLESKYGEAGLIRIGKSQLINLYHVTKLKSIGNSRIEVTIKSGEKLVVSRHYTQMLKQKLGLLE